MLLETKNLRTYFHVDEGVVKAVDGVSLVINEGEIVGLVGESGCGKSTTAFSIVRLLPDEAEAGGKVLFKGTDLLKEPEEYLNKLRGKEVSMVFQDPITFLNPVMKIKQQVAEPLILHRGLKKREAEQKSIDILRAMGLGDAPGLAESYPHQLSGGMRQRVLLAIALACGPSLLIADEPFTALDVSIQDQLIQLLKQKQAELKFSCLLITHDLGVTAEMCDTIYVMYAGEVVEAADLSSIYNNPKHPYTKALIDSAKLGSSESDELPHIPGDVPSMLDPPAGCRFHPRCPYAFEPCYTKQPIRTQVNNTHWVRCWLNEPDAG